MSNKIAITLAESASLISALALANKKEIPIEEVITDKRKRSVLATNGSITRLLADTIISPTIRVSSSLRRSETIESAIKANIDYFAAFYGSALSMLVSRKGFEVDDALRVLSSKRTRTLGDISDAVGECLKGDMDFLPLNMSDSTIELKGEGKEEDSYGVESRYIFLRTLELKINSSIDGDPKKTTIIPIVVRAIIEYVDSSSILQLLKTKNQKDKSFWAAWHRYGSTEDSLSDLIMGTKLLNDEKSGRLKDTDDLFKEMHEREADANRMLVTDGIIGFGKYYMMLIIDSNTKSQVENIIKERISKENGKDLALESLLAMSITVMDEASEMLTIYFNHLPGNNMITYKSLKKKGKDDDIKDILKIFAQRM